MPHPRGCEVSPTELGTRSGPRSCCASLEASELLPPHRKSGVGTRLWPGFSWLRPRGSWHLDGDPGGIKSKPTLQCFHCLFSTSTGVSRGDITSGWRTGRPCTNLYANAPIHSTAQPHPHCGLFPGAMWRPGHGSGLLKAAAPPLPPQGSLQTTLRSESIMPSCQGHFH